MGCLPSFEGHALFGASALKQTLPSTKSDPHLRAVSGGWCERGQPVGSVPRNEGLRPLKPKGRPTLKLAGPVPRTEGAPTQEPGPGRRPYNRRGEKRKHMASPPGTAPKTGGLTTPLLEYCPPALDTAVRTLLRLQTPATPALLQLFGRCWSRGGQLCGVRPLRPPTPNNHKKGASSKLRLP